MTCTTPLSVTISATALGVVDEYAVLLERNIHVLVNDGCHRHIVQQILAPNLACDDMIGQNRREQIIISQHGVEEAWR